jgi:outer membrane protein TolC
MRGPAARKTPDASVMKFLARIGILFGLLCFSAVAADCAENFPPSPRAFTLAEAVSHALEANPGLEARLRVVEQARMQIGVAQSYFWPTASFFYQRNQLHNDGGIGNTDELSNRAHSNGIRLGLNLFSGFTHLNNLEQSRLSADVESARHLQARHELILNVQLQFLQLLKLREDRKTLLDARRRMEIQLAAAKAFVEVEMAPRLNVLQNEVELAHLAQQEITVANNIRSVEAQLNHYLGLPSSQSVAYTGDLREFNGVLDISGEDALTMAVRRRPDAVIALKSIAVAEKQSLVTAGRFLPTVTLNYDKAYYSRDYESSRSQDYSRHYASLGLVFNWTLFEGGSTGFALLADRKRVAALRKDYEDTMSAIRTEVIRNLMDIDAARELVTASRKAVEAAAEAYRMSERRYNTHIGTITDLLDSQAKLTRAEADADQAVADFHSARARFYYSIGMERHSLQ